MVRFRKIDKEGLTSFAQRLVRTPSPSAREADVAALVSEEMRKVGFAEVRVDRMGNVIGRIGPNEGRKLLYDAHMDTVEMGDREAWRRDPFGGAIENGILYGRGACDMKGALAAMVYAAKAIVDSRVTLQGDLYIVAVVQEEPCEGHALQYVIERGNLRPNWVVLGEATDLHLARGQRGRLECCITVRGRSSHAAAPERGVNAIYAAARVIVGLELLAQQLSQDELLGKGSIAVTEIGSLAASRNVVPDQCTLYVDRRLATGETEAKALAEIRRVLTREGAEAIITVPEYHSLTYTGHEIAVRQYFPSWITPEDEPALVEAEYVVEDVLGYMPRLGLWQFSTDGVYSAGVAGIPTLGFGPGEERHAHTVEDQVKLKDLEAAAKVYAELAVRLLNGG